MNLQSLENINQVAQLIEDSQHHPVFILKHSERCSISRLAYSRLLKDWDFDDDKLDTYIVEVVHSKNISHIIAETFHIKHESPQVLLIDKGICTYHESHNAINFDDIRDEIQNISRDN